MRAYQNSLEHIFDELRRIDLRLRIRIERERSGQAEPAQHEYRGLVISEEEMEELLQSFDEASSDATQGESAEAERLISELENLDREIAAGLRESAALGVTLFLREIENRFGLTPFDTGVLLVCLAPELDLKYERLYAYLQDDVTSKRPTIDLIFRLFCETPVQRVQARARFAGQAPLFRSQIVSLNGEENGSQSFLSRPLKLDERIVRYLLGIDVLDEAIAIFSQLITPSSSTDGKADGSALDDLLLPAEEKSKLRAIFESMVRFGAAPGNDGVRGLVLHGPPGIGKKYAAEALCASAGLGLLVADLAHLPVNASSLKALIGRVFREAQLRGAAVYLEHAEASLAEQEPVRNTGQILLQAMETFPGPVFLGSAKPWKTSTLKEAQDLINFGFPGLDYDARRRLWRRIIPNSTGPGAVSEDEIGTIAGKFQFTPGKIQQALAETRRRAIMRPQSPPEITAEDLSQSCRSQSTTNLANLAQKINPLFTWDDIILPPDTLRHLKEICLHVKHRQRVFADWNFNKKISLGKGASALFAGPPGTGKTMAAEIIAAELGLDIYKIDLSTVVSKYIGETEKNLSRIFQEAEQSNAILFFDEADALFGKRSEVKDSHDRYANIEINYLLQKMEEYEGIVIMATNFQKNIDEAFTRRLRFIVEIPFPDRNYRARIWRKIFPAEMPRSKDLEFDFLAGKFEISGGHIKNIALSAAFLAAENSGMVGMKHIIRATRREFQKMGRVFVKADFGEYYDLLEND
jgi:SpoVK/Ycf46/Vps4 family AAA+-type ATPase